MEIKDLEKFIERLFYGSDFASYDSGINLRNIIPEIHYRIFGAGFNTEVDYGKDKEKK